MIFVFAAVLWVIIVITLAIIFRDYKKEYSLMKYRVEVLEQGLNKVVKNEPGKETVLKINRMATEMLTILQEKEDDIRDLMQMLEDEKIKRESDKVDSSTNAKIYNYPSEVKEYSGMSESEFHMFQKMKKRRAVNE